MANLNLNNAILEDEVARIAARAEKAGRNSSTGEKARRKRLLARLQELGRTSASAARAWSRLTKRAFVHES